MDIIEQIKEKIDWAMLDRETRDQVKVLIGVCAHLWNNNSAQARKLESAIVALWGCSYEDTPSEAKPQWLDMDPAIVQQMTEVMEQW